MSSSQDRPGLAPPKGQISDFSAPNTLFVANIVIQTCVLFLTTSLVVTRCVIRRFLAGIWALEDWLCLLSWAMFVILISMACQFVTIGGGSHQWNVRHEQMPDLLYWNNVCEVFYNAVILMTKVALLYMYLQIFAPRKKSGNWWAVIIVMVSNIVFYTIQFFIKIYLCVPRDAIWDKSITNKHCIANLDVILFTTSAWNTISDIIILCLPAIFVGKLKMNSRKKVGIIAVFTVGAIAPIFSVVGIVYRVLHASSEDQIYWQPRILLFSEAEITTGIICTCLPAFQRLFKRNRGFASSSASRQKYGPRNNYLNLDRRRTRTLPSGSTPHYLDSELLELTETPEFVAHNTLVSPNSVSTKIAGGQNPVQPAGQNQIWKTTEVHIQFEDGPSADTRGSESASDNEIHQGAYLSRPERTHR